MGNEVTYALDACQGLSAVRDGSKQLLIVSAGKSIQAYEVLTEIACNDPALRAELAMFVCEDGERHEMLFVSQDTYPNIARKAVDMIWDAVDTFPTVSRVELQATLGKWLGYEAQDILDFITSETGRTCVCDCCGGIETATNTHGGTEMMLKLHVHDCESCEWMGSYDGADLYRCGTTIIARMSDDGPDYASTDLRDCPDEKYTGSNRHLREAYRRYTEGCEVQLIPRTGG